MLCQCCKRANGQNLSVCASCFVFYVVCTVNVVTRDRVRISAKISSYRCNGHTVAHNHHLVLFNTAPNTCPLAATHRGAQEATTAARRIASKPKSRSRSPFRYITPTCTLTSEPFRTGAFPVHRQCTTRPQALVSGMCIYTVAAGAVHVGTALLAVLLGPTSITSCTPTSLIMAWTAHMILPACKEVHTQQVVEPQLISNPSVVWFTVGPVAGNDSSLHTSVAVTPFPSTQTKSPNCRQHSSQLYHSTPTRQSCNAYIPFPAHSHMTCSLDNATRSLHHYSNTSLRHSCREGLASLRLSELST
jgi:hypothetical protein